MIAAHADWSIDPRKRWLTRAERRDGIWQATAPRPVGDLAALLAGLLAPGLPVALGLDLPLGLPRAYAAGRGEADFAGFLRGLAATPEFFAVSPGLDTSPPPGPSTPRAASAA